MTTLPTPLEADVVASCDRLVRTMGGDVVQTSPPGRTRQHVGLPDRRYRLKHRAWWFEAKKPDGKLTAEQLAFLRDELSCDALALCGGFADLAGLLERVLRGEPTTALVAYCHTTIDAWAARGLRRTLRRSAP